MPKVDQAKLLEIIELVDLLAGEFDVAVELPGGEAERDPRPGIVADQTFRSAGYVPVLSPFASRNGLIHDLKNEFLSLGGDQLRVGAGVVPKVAIATPEFAVPVEDLRFQAF